MLRQLVAVTVTAALMTGAWGSHGHGGETVYDFAVPNGGTKVLDGNAYAQAIPSSGILEPASGSVSVGASAVVADQTVNSIRTTGTDGIGIGRRVGGTRFAAYTAFNLTVDGDIESSGTLSIGDGIHTLTADTIVAAGDIVVGDGTASVDDALELIVTTTGAFGISSDTGGIHATVSGAGTTVTAGSLLMGDPASGGNQVVVVEKRASLNILNDAVTSLHNENAGGGLNTIVLSGADAGFAGGLTVGTRGQLVIEQNPAHIAEGGTAVSNLGVGVRDATAATGGLTVQSTGGLVVGNGATLNVLQALDGDTDGDIVLTGGGEISMGENSTLNAGVLVIDNGSSALVGSGTGSVLNLKGLTVAAGADFLGHLDVRINGGVGNIQGSHTMLGDESYDSLIIGADGLFSFESNEDRTLTLGAATGATGTITLTQAGTLFNAGNGDLTIKGATHINVVKNATNTDVATIRADVDGNLIATDSILTVDADLRVTTATNTEISVKQLIVTAGDVLATGDGTFSSAEQAVIGGADSASYRVDDGGVTAWHKGVRIGKNGTVGLNATSVTNGSFTVGGDIILDGGAIDGSTNGTALAFTKEGTTTPEVLITGAGSSIGNQVDFGGMDLVVTITEPDSQGGIESVLEAGARISGIANAILKKGEIVFGDASSLTISGDLGIADGAGLYADGAAAAIAATGPDSSFTLDRGGWAAADASAFIIDGFKSARLDGAMAFGLRSDNVSAGRLVFDADTDVAIGNDAQFIFDAELTGTLNITTPVTYDDDEKVIIEGGQNKVAFADRTVKSGLGQFGVGRLTGATAGEGDRVSIISAANNVWTGKTYEQQVTQMQDNLRSALDDNGFGAYATRDLAAAVHGVTVAPLAPDADHGIRVHPTSSDAEPNYAGTNNYLQLEMIGTATGSIHESQLASLLGVNVNNGVLATIGTVHSFGARIANRLAANRAVLNELDGSDDANAAMLLTRDYENRIWAGALGHWEDGDRRHGIDGYEYDSYGLILGYDRYFGCNLVAGVAFAYSTGDFEAKSAIRDDSDMDNYSFQGYLGYNAPNGIFATLTGGYTYTDNDNRWSAFENINGGNVATRHSEDYDTDSWNIGGRFGYDWTPGGSFVLTPSIGLSYIHASAKAHDRNSSRDGVSWTASRMEKTTVDALLLPVEVAAGYDVNFANGSRLSIKGNVGYSYNFKKDGGDASIILNGLGQGTENAPVVLRSIGREQSRHTWNFGAGLHYRYNEFEVGVKYDYYLQSDTDAHRLMGSVGWNF